MAVKGTKHGPGSMSFGKAMLYGAGTALGFLGAAMMIHFAGDVYDAVIRKGLLKPAEGEIPPAPASETVSGLYSHYYRR